MTPPPALSVIENSDVDDMKKELMAKPRQFLVALTYNLYRGNVPFAIGQDDKTSSKKSLVNYLFNNFPEAKIRNALAVLEGRQAIHIDASNGEDGGLGKAMARAFNDVIKKSVDPKELRGMIVEEIKKLPPYNVHIHLNETPLAELEGYMRPELHDAMTKAVHRLNILMVGPAGCGKTFIAKQVADAMDMRFGSISCSSGMSESHLTGWLIPRGEQGQFEYTMSVFVDIYENGGVFLFDEIDAADSNTLLFVNQALANGRFFLPQRYNNPLVVKHPDCIIMAAANTYGTGANLSYAGRERLDESTLDRFRAGVIVVGYDDKLEEHHCENEILVWGRAVRKKIVETKLQRIMSTRFMMDASKLKRSGYPFAQIKETYFCGWREEERKKVEA